MLGVEHPSRLSLNEFEITEWMCYYERYPFGDDVTHSMFAKILAVATGKPDRDFMPQLEQSIEGMSDEQILQSVPGGHDALNFLRTVTDGDC